MNHLRFCGACVILKIIVFTFSYDPIGADVCKAYDYF